MSNYRIKNKVGNWDIIIIKLVWNYSSWLSEISWNLLKTLWKSVAKIFDWIKL
jgi:hypothetical protein